MTIDVDVLIFGGGCGGLWLLDALRRRGKRVLLLEHAGLGSGQTVAAQGIIHGGLKYTLTGGMSGSARAIREMPEVWRQCLAGDAEPDLSAMRLRGQWCCLWRTQSLRSKAGMVGARAGLRVKPTALAEADRPEPLTKCPGVVYRLDEQVVDPVSFLDVMLNRNGLHLLRIDAGAGLDFDVNHPGDIRAVRLRQPGSERGSAELTVRPAHVVFAAGGGNGTLRRQVGLSDQAMQKRPLHMTLLRGTDDRLPPLNGHCVDGFTTRVTITTNVDSTGRTVWQVGGEVSEVGVSMRKDELIRHVKSELKAVMPGMLFEGVEWAAYRVDRAEGRTADGARPEDAQVSREGNVVTAWPTKLALAPRLTERVIEGLRLSREGNSTGMAGMLRSIAELHWPRPKVAQPPWEREQEWTSDV